MTGGSSERERERERVVKPGGSRAAALALLVLLILVACLRVAATYRVFSETADEHHFVAGIEWWDQGRYSYTIFHPPLARIFSAFPLFVAGSRSHGLSDIVAEKNAILYGKGEGLGDYVRNLSLARVGILPFLATGIVAVWVWAQRLSGNVAAFSAALLFSTLPPVLAHAGLSTTDAALTATLTLALFGFCLWLDEPSRRHAILLGVAGGLAILSKFSVFPLFCASAVAILVTRGVLERGAGRGIPPGRRIASLAAAAAVAALLVWAGYRFSWGALPAEATGPVARTVLRGPGAIATSGIPVPAPELWDGLRQIRGSVYLQGGHPSYLLGRYSLEGWWYYFPIALAVKTPLAFLILAAWGAGAVAHGSSPARTGGDNPPRRDWRLLAPIVAAAGILIASLFSRTDIGVRHILPIYPLLAIAAGCGMAGLWKMRVGRAAVAVRFALVALVGWQLSDSIRAHPDYLPYFNELAGKHPDEVLLDSNLDWGQDLLRLSTELQSRKIDSVALAYFGNADLSRHGLPPLRPVPPDHPTTGWVAISEMCLKDVAGQGSAYRWLRERQPVTRVGRSIRLYYFSP